MIPAPADLPARKHGLWEETCFEFFLGVKDSPRYWEFNLSPAGHWNVYRFAGYRQGMEEETAFTALPFRDRRGSDSLVALKMNVVRGSSGRVSPWRWHRGSHQARRRRADLWALTHPGPRPTSTGRTVFWWNGDTGLRSK